MGLVILLVMLAGIVVYFIAIYNDLVGARNGCKNAFAEIDAQLTHRHELISQLLQSLQGETAGDKATLERVGSARNAAVSALAAASSLRDPSAMQQLSAAENQVTLALDELLAAMKTTQKVQALIEELRSSEETRLLPARRTFNAAAMDYNRGRQGWPNALIANLFEFPPARLLEMDMPQRPALPRSSLT